MSKPRIGVYPGTFDPLTNGHMDIITRSLKVVDELILGVAINAGKAPLFSLEERVEMVEQQIAKITNGGGERIRVVPFENLLTDFVEEVGASMIMRGLRAVSDFEYEFQMAGMNAQVNSRIETVFLMASGHNQFIASRFVKEIARLNGDVSGFVATEVSDKLKSRYKELNGA